MKKVRKIFIACLAVSVIVMIVGYFLQTILIPIQDIDMASKAELLELQKSLAVNYPAGNIMFRCGIIGTVVFSVLLIGQKFCMKSHD